jgi:30S ribosomal protein S31
LIPPKAGFILSAKEFSKADFLRHLLNKKFSMGRGDKKTKKGKTFKGSFGKSRPASKKKITGNVPVKKDA